jgi:hypothetical protein
MNLFYCDLYNRRAASNTNGDTLTFPELVAGQVLRYGLRFLRWQGNFFEEDQPLAGLRVSIGARDARPLAGTYKIKVGAGPSTESNTTSALDWNASPAKVAVALNAVSGGPGDFVVDDDFGSLLIRRATGAAVSLSVVSNRLHPTTTGRIGGTQIDGDWIYDLRLTQMPLAFSDSAERELPPAPSIETIQAGGSDPSGTFFWNEIQALRIPPTFRGTYQLRRGYAKTRVLDAADGPDELQDALNEILAPEGGRVTVTNPTDNTAHIEFQGDLGGLDLEELIVQVYSAPPGDWTFDLNLDTYAMRAALRDSETISVPFEGEADIYIDESDPSLGTRTIKLWSTAVTVRRPLIWPDLASVQDVDWLRPPSPRNYKPFTLNQILTGQQQAFSAVIGDDTATEFVLDHNLDSDLVQIVVRENSTPGRLLRPDEYEVEINDSDQITVSFDAAPDEDSLAVYCVAIGPESVFQTHTHTIAQVVDLADILDDFGQRLETLEAILPSTGPAAPAQSSSEGMKIVIPEVTKVLHYRGESPEMGDAGLEGLPTRAPLMLPAVHDGTVATLTDPLPDPLTTAGDVYENEGSAAVLIPGGGGIRASRAEPDGFVGSDGRILYPANRWSTTNSYYPANFEQVLFAFAINDKMMAVNRTLECTFGIRAQLVGANCKAQWVAVIELGTFEEEDEPATLGLNLENVTWGAPVLSQPIILTRLVQTHFFGVRVRRRATEMLLDAQLYGVWSGNNSAAPADANFAVRARLVKFDTENIADPRGWVGYQIIGSSEVDEDGKSTTKPAQARIF